MKGECLLPQGQVHAIIYQVWLGQVKLGFVRTDILDLSEQSVVFGGIRQFTVERDEFFIPILMEFGIRQSELKKLQEFVVPNLKKCVIPSRKNALVYTSTSMVPPSQLLPELRILLESFYINKDML